MTSSATSLALTLAFIVSSARPIDCQQLRVLEVGVQPAAGASVTEFNASTLSLNAKTVGWSISGALFGGAAGLMVDQMYCRRHHGHEQAALFGPCSFYFNEGFGAGWFGGAIVGSTFGAARIAHKRGCPRRAAIWRAMAGAAIGVAPGLSIAARRPGKYPPSRSVVIATAPLLGGVGATAAVVGCHAA